MSVEIETMAELDRALDPFARLRCGVCGALLPDGQHSVIGEDDWRIITCPTAMYPMNGWRGVGACR